MPFWKKKRPAGVSLDEFVGDGDARAASDFDLGRATERWQERLAKAGHSPPARADLALPAFSLIKGGDMFERPRGQKPKRTTSQLLEQFIDKNLAIHKTKVAQAEREAALTGIQRVLAGNPAIARRMLLAKPMTLVIVPEGRDFREFGFPRHTNPNAAGIFWNREGLERALLGLREEYILPKPWLMVHEMTHAVHFLALTKRERKWIDQMLMPVYRSPRWVEEALAIYAERAFGAEYGEEEYRAPGLYGKTRRDWNPQHVFSLFVSELLKP